MEKFKCSCGEIIEVSEDCLHIICEECSHSYCIVTYNGIKRLADYN